MVVAIIGVLATVVLASLNSTRGKTRDAKRLSDLKQIETALEMYHLDNGSYPAASGWRGNCSAYGSHGTTGASGYIPNLAPDYIPVLPLDPKPINTHSCYLYRSGDADSYMFLVYLTVEGSIPDSLKRSSYPFENNYAVYRGNGSTY